MSLSQKYLTTLLFFFFYVFPAYSLENSYLSKEDIETFYKQGFFIQRQALTKDEICFLEKNVAEILDNVKIAIDGETPSLNLKQNDPPFFELNGSRVVLKKNNTTYSIARIVGVGGLCPDLLKILRSEKMMTTYCSLLDTRELEHIICQLHPKLPNDQVSFPRHQDLEFRKFFDPEWSDVSGNGSYAICIIPLDPMNQENGGLWVDENNYPIDEKLPEKKLWLCAQPGDLIFLHPHVYHGSEPNSSTKSRKTLLTGFCSYGANHKTYPGAYVNSHIIQEQDGSFSITPSSWDNKTTTPNIQH